MTVAGVAVPATRGPGYAASAPYTVCVFGDCTPMPVADTTPPNHRREHAELEAQGDRHRGRATGGGAPESRS